MNREVRSGCCCWCCFPVFVFSSLICANYAIKKITLVSQGIWTFVRKFPVGDALLCSVQTFFHHKMVQQWSLVDCKSMAILLYDQLYICL